VSGGPGPDAGFAPADVFDPVEACFPDGVGVALGLVIDLLFDLIAELVDFDELHDLLLLGLELTVDSTVWLGFYLCPWHS